MAGKHAAKKKVADLRSTKRGRVATTFFAIALAVSLLIIAPIIAIAGGGPNDQQPAEVIAQTETVTENKDKSADLNGSLSGEDAKTEDTQTTESDDGTAETTEPSKLESGITDTVNDAVETPQVVITFFNAVDDLADALKAENPNMDKVNVLGQKAMDAYEAVQNDNLEDYDGVAAKLEELMTLSDSPTVLAAEMPDWSTPTGKQELILYAYSTCLELTGHDVKLNAKGSPLGEESGMLAGDLVKDESFEFTNGDSTNDYVFRNIEIQDKAASQKTNATHGDSMVGTGTTPYAIRYNQNRGTWEYCTDEASRQNSASGWHPFMASDMHVIAYYLQKNTLHEGDNPEDNIILFTENYGTNSYGSSSSNARGGYVVYQLYDMETGKAVGGYLDQYFYSPYADKVINKVQVGDYWNVEDIAVMPVKRPEAITGDLPDSEKASFVPSEWSGIKDCSVGKTEDFVIPFKHSWENTHGAGATDVKFKKNDVNVYVVGVLVSPRVSETTLNIHYLDNEDDRVSATVSGSKGVPAKKKGTSDPTWTEYVSVVDGKVNIINGKNPDDENEIIITTNLDSDASKGHPLTLAPTDLKPGYNEGYVDAKLVGNNLYLYFDRNEDQHSISAQVVYYKDGEPAETEEVEPATGWIGEDTTVTVAPNTINKFIGYKYESTDGALSYTVAAGEATDETTHVVKVYYVKDESATHSVSARVDYYKDGVLAETGAVETETGWIGKDTTVTVEPNTTNKFEGYGYESTKGDLSYTVVADDPTDTTVHVVNVYYVKEYKLTVNYIDDEGNELHNIVADEVSLENPWDYPTKYRNGDPYTVADEQVPNELIADDHHYVIDPDSPLETTGTIEGKDAVVTLVYTLDEIGDPEDPKKDGDDGTPDKYQQKVAFNVENGDWDEGGNARIVEVLNFYKGDKLSADADAVAEMVAAPAVGTKPDDGFSAVYDKDCWSLTVPPTGSVKRAQVAAEYTYTYPPVYTITVNYIDDDSEEPVTLQDSWTDKSQYLNKASYAVDDKHAPEDLIVGDDHYILDPEKRVATSGSINGANVEITLVYTLDNIVDPTKDPDGDDSDPKPGDTIPDKYQKLVNFQVVNGYWNAGDNNNITGVLTFYKNGELSNADDAVATMVAEPPVGEEPEEGYWKGYNPNNWDKQIPESVTRAQVGADDTYTYTYRLARTITVIFEDEDGEPVGDPIVTEVEDDDPYNVEEDTEKVPDGFEPNGESTGDPVEGIADDDKVIKVPVKKVPTYTLIVNYVDDVNGEPLQDSWTDDNEYRIGASYAVADEQIPAEINVGDDHYIWESTTSNASGQMPEGGVEVTVVYTLDNIVEPDRDPEPLNPGDEIPDKYQVIVNYVSANENQGTVTGDISKVITLMNGTEYVQAATIVPGTAGVITTALENNEFAGWDIDPNTALDAKGGETYTYTAEWNYLGEGEPPAPPAPAEPPAPAPAPGGPLAPIVAPIVEAINDLLNPLADEAIDDDGNPLFGLHAPGCWTHWLMILGALITIVYLLSALYSRRSKTHDMDDFEDEVLDESGTRVTTTTSASHAAHRIV